MKKIVGSQFFATAVTFNQVAELGHVKHAKKANYLKLSCLERFQICQKTFNGISGNLRKIEF